MVLYLMLSPLTAAGTLFLAGCDARPVADPTAHRDHGSMIQPSASSMRERQAAFFNRIREADPDAKTIERALLNERNELGLVLDRSVELDKIPALMRVMLTKMAAEFPGEDLTILAYAPSSPPRRIGTARLDVRTRDMTYTAER